MKKTLLIFALGALLSTNITAQSDFTLNSRAWTTNYWTMLIYDVAHLTVSHFLFSEDADRDVFSRIVPSAALVFPVGIEKAGFDANDIYGPYHRAFGNPFTHPGDFGIGIDASWKPGFAGVYAGAYFKSQELCFRNGDDLRGLYFQPRAGVIMGQNGAIEAGVYYDMTVGVAGNYPNASKSMLLDGLGLDFALSYGRSNGNRGIISFMLPLHNFLNENHASGAFTGMKRRVGYIMLTQRISF